jgi:hypothetical protein
MLATKLALINLRRLGSYQVFICTTMAGNYKIIIGRIKEYSQRGVN